jgi:hypothetical protein
MELTNGMRAFFYTFTHPKTLSMKNFLILLSVFLFVACSKAGDESTPSSNSNPCGTHNGKQLYKGSQGGCYYINSNGNKTYVEAGECNC